MKNTIRIILPIFLLANILFSGCEKDEEDCIITEQYYSGHEVLKKVVKTNVTNISTGFHSMFQHHFSDSSSRSGFSRTFTHAALFFTDNSGYVFTETNNAYNIAHPGNPSLEGTYTGDITDVNGKPIVEEMIDISKYIGYGFLEYTYNNPTTASAEKKTTFVKSIIGSDWYLGSGFYESDEGGFLSSIETNKLIARECVLSVGKGLSAVLGSYAADSLQGLGIMRDFIQHIRFFDDHSGYFYVIDFSGYNVVQPPDPSYQGTYEYDLQDSHGNYLVQGLIETAKNGGGFYEYYWIDYITGKEKLKTAYVMQIPGYDYLIGTGIYASED